MFRSRTVWAGVAVWAVVAWGAWTMLVPTVISGATLAWANAIVAVVIVVTRAMMKGASPTRSVAHILYDAEHASERRQ